MCSSPISRNRFRHVVWSIPFITGIAIVVVAFVNVSFSAEPPLVVGGKGSGQAITSLPVRDGSTGDVTIASCTYSVAAHSSFQYEILAFTKGVQQKLATMEFTSEEAESGQLVALSGQFSSQDKSARWIISPAIIGRPGFSQKCEEKASFPRYAEIRSSVRTIPIKVDPGQAVVVFAYELTDGMKEHDPADASIPMELAELKQFSKSSRPQSIFVAGVVALPIEP